MSVRRNCFVTMPRPFETGNCNRTSVLGRAKVGIQQMDGHFQLQPYVQ